jgi:hypothetical protein
MAFAEAKAGGMRCRRALRAVSPTGLRQHGSALRAGLLFPGLGAPSAWLGTGSDFCRAAFGLAQARLCFAGVFVRGLVLGVVAATLPSPANSGFEWATRQELFVEEKVFVDTFQVHCLLNARSDVVADHECGQSLAIYQNNFEWMAFGEVLSGTGKG